MPGPYSDVQTGGGGGGLTTAQYNALVAQIQANTREIISNDGDISGIQTVLTINAGEVPRTAFEDLSNAVSSLESGLNAVKTTYADRVTVLGFQTDLSARIDELTERVTVNEAEISNNNTTIIHVQTAQVTRDEFDDLSGAVFSLETRVNQNEEDISQNTFDISLNKITIRVIPGDPPEDLDTGDSETEDTNNEDPGVLPDEPPPPEDLDTGDSDTEDTNNEDPGVLPDEPPPPGFWGTIQIFNMTMGDIGFAIPGMVPGIPIPASNTPYTVTVPESQQVASFILERIERTNGQTVSVTSGNSNATITQIETSDDPQKNYTVTPKTLTRGTIQIMVIDHI